MRPEKGAQLDGIQGTARQIFKGLSLAYDSVLDYATLFQDRYWKSWLVDTAGVKEGWTVLDLGCGTCVLEGYLSSRGCRVTGLDLTEEMLRIGQSKRIACVDSLLVGDAERLPYTDHAFDAVFSCYVAKYCDQRTLVGEIGRVLKPGGMLALYDFSKPRGFFAPFHAFYVFGVLKILGRLFRRLHLDFALTFDKLPDIIKARSWEETLWKALGEEGFVGVSKRTLSGGVVTTFHATAPLG